MLFKPVITIEGLSATGKSTIAKALAKKLGFKFIDVGVLFRGIASLVLKGAKQVTLGLEDEVTFNSQALPSDITSTEVTMYTSKIGADPIFREEVYDFQKRIAEKYPVVISGRDSSAKIFPNISVKFFVVADDNVRAARRAKDMNEDIEKVKLELLERDRKDLAFQNVIKSNDVITIDNSTKTVDEIVQEMYEIVKPLYKEYIHSD